MRFIKLSTLVLATTCLAAQASEERTTGDGVRYRSYADEQVRHSYNARHHGQYKNNPKQRPAATYPAIPTQNQVDRRAGGRVTYRADSLRQQPGSQVRVLDRYTGQPVPQRRQNLPAPKPPMVMAPHKNQPKQPQAFVRGSILKKANRHKPQSDYAQYDAHGTCGSTVLQQHGFTQVKRVPNTRDDCYYRRNTGGGAGFIDGTRGSTSR